MTTLSNSLTESERNTKRLLDIFPLPPHKVSNMKHYLFFFLIALLLVEANQAFAYDAMIDGVYYNLKSGEAEVTYKKFPHSTLDYTYRGIVIIPETVFYEGKNYPVTSIGREAFKYSQISSIVIPKSVRTIGAYAFMDSKVISVTIGAGVTTIGQQAFAHVDASLDKKPTPKIIWLPNTPPNGYNQVEAEINYVANDLYEKLQNKVVYPFLSSIFEEGGIKYVPISFTDRTCDAIDCNYDEKAEKIHIGNIVNHKGISMKVLNVNPRVCQGNDFIKEIHVDFDGDLKSYSFYDCDNINNAIIANNGNVNSLAFTSSKIFSTLIINNHGDIEGFSLIGGGFSAIVNNQGVIGKKCFSGSNITKIEIGSNVSSIEIMAFNGCDSLKSVQIPNSVKSIGNSTFSGCKSLEHVSFGNGIVSIGYGMFYNCTSLKSIIIPKSVSKIENFVFHGCKSLSTVILEDANTELYVGKNEDKGLFNDCALDSVYIGRILKYSPAVKDGYSPFYRNVSLRSVHITNYEKEIGENEFYGCVGLRNVRIGHSVISIGNWAFSNCSSLDYFEFGSSMSTIGTEAFSDCANITKIISHATIPPTCGLHAMDDINKWDCTLIVPDGSTAAYQQASQWKEFLFVEGLSAGVELPTTDATANEPVYTLSGQRLKAPRKGINIVGGRKVVVK